MTAPGLKIKICGITRLEDYQEAVLMGADYVGFIFYPPSPRYIVPFQAELMCRRVHRGVYSPHQRVGVFVNESIGQVRHIYHAVGLDIVQLHGDESPEYVRTLGLPCWKVIRVRDIASLKTIVAYPCDTFLLDTYQKDCYGGTGTPFPFEIAVVAATMGKRIIVSGGISAQNIGTLLSFGTSFYGVDINSSVEDIPGKKNPAKLKHVLSLLKSQPIAPKNK